MSKKLNDKIEVKVDFKIGKMIPISFLWDNRVYDIEKINMVHSERLGGEMIYYFSVSDSANFFRLAFFTRDLSWRIEDFYNS